MRVLLITRNLPPLMGGMERLMQQAVAGLASRYQVSVIGPDGCSKYLPDNIAVHEISSKRNGFILKALSTSTSLIRHEKFDCVIGGSGLVAPHVAAIQAIAKTPGIVFVHGLDIVADNFIYQRIFVPCLRHVNTLIANSSNTSRLLLEKGVSSERIAIVYPGTDIVHGETEADLAWLRTYIGSKKRKVLLFVGRLTPRKGLYAFVEKSLGKIIDLEPSTLLLIVGDRPSDSLSQQKDELDRIVRCINQKNLGEHVVFLGTIDHETLSKCYSVADCLVFPLIPVAGDVEGFGMVAIEAAAFGTPTVAFEEGGVADAIDDGVSGYLVEPQNYQKFTDSVLRVLGQEKNYRTACIEHSKAFSWSVFHNKLFQIVESTARLDKHSDTVA